MGHACTKDQNAEKLEQRRIEREKRLGLYRPRTVVPLSPAPNLVPNGMWPRSQEVEVTRMSRPMFQHPPTPVAGSMQTQFQVPNVARQTGPWRNWNSPERQAPRHNPNSPFNDARPPLATRPQESNLRSRLTNEVDTFRDLQPIVVQALSQLCAIELQERVYIINEESATMSKLLRMLENIQELEAVRAAGRELIALEQRSRASVDEQEAHQRELLWKWASEMLQEARLSTLIRQTQDRQGHSLSRPPSLQGSPARDNGGITQALGWVPESYSSRTPTRESPLRSLPTNRDGFARLSEVADRMVSQEEEALCNKIARQRGLIDSTRAMYRKGDAPPRFDPTAPIRAPPSTPPREYPMRAAPQLDSKVEMFREPRSSLSLREASVQATKSRLNALAYYQ